MRLRLAFVIVALSIPLISFDARAQWQLDGTAISTAPSDQFYPTIVADGAGGAIVTWYDYRSGTADIYAQRVNASGTPQWTADGVAICAAASDQFYPTIVADGAGGAIVTWHDYRSGDADIYAQRVNASGTPQWTANGVALCTAANNQEYPWLDSDGAGGATVTWHDYRSGDPDIYAQRVNASGTPQWTADGVAICIAASDQSFPVIVADGAGEAIVTWHDYRSDTDYDIYVQRVNATGVPQWTANGVALCTAANSQYFPNIVADGAGGAMVTWSDERNGRADIYAQRVNASGTPQWTADGVALCTAANDQSFSWIVTDGAGGAIVTWHDYRSGTNYDIYAQWVNASGTPQWTANGVALCTAANTQHGPQIVSDGAGGAIVTWYDLRSGTNYDIYAQWVNASGTPQWTANGVALCTAANSQYAPTIVADGAGGAIVTWYDFRSGTDYDIYAQHVTDSAVATAIASFDATEADGVVTLHGAFRSDLAIESVNVYRADGTERDPLTIHEEVDAVRGDRFEYVDRGVVPGATYRYRIGVVDADGEFFSPVVTVSVSAIAASLAQNRPNPFNPTTTIRFVLPTRERVTLAIYDATGRLVRTLLDEVRDHGAHEVAWDGRDDDSVAMGSGVYFYRLHAGKHTESKKMVLLK